MRIPKSKSTMSVNISYWEFKKYFTAADLIIVGSGIVGLNAAINFKKKNKKARVLVIERGILPMGASTKNAGFACFGSPSELISDLKLMKEEVVWETVKMRWNGLKLLRKNLGDKNIAFHQWGGYELFSSKSKYEECLEQLPYLNSKTKEILGEKITYTGSSNAINGFGFKKINGIILNKFEGQIDTSMMYSALHQLALNYQIEILNNVEVQDINDSNSIVTLNTNLGELKAKKCIVAVNGFAGKLLGLKTVSPARAQVLITKPVPSLKLKGTFHYDEGFYYFRNIDNRILFGGGRNLDLKLETTSKISLTPKIQNHLEELLKTVIIPKQKFVIEHRWAGIMGVGAEKKPIIKHYSPNVVCAVRMGGMGVAIGSLVGKEAAKLIAD